MNGLEGESSVSENPNDVTLSPSWDIGVPGVVGVGGPDRVSLSESSELEETSSPGITKWEFSASVWQRLLVAIECVDGV